MVSRGRTMRGRSHCSSQHRGTASRVAGLGPSIIVPNRKASGRPSSNKLTTLHVAVVLVILLVALADGGRDFTESMFAGRRLLRSTSDALGVQGNTCLVWLVLSCSNHPIVIALEVWDSCWRSRPVLTARTGDISRRSASRTY